MGTRCCSGMPPVSDIVVEQTEEFASTEVFNKFRGQKDAALQHEHELSDVKLGAAGRVTIMESGAQSHRVLSGSEPPPHVHESAASGSRGNPNEDSFNDGASFDGGIVAHINKGIEAEESVCVLYWILGTTEQCSVSREVLISLHSEIGNCVSLFQANILRDGATSGVIRGFPDEREDMTAADVTVRIGQLLCRWAAHEDPPVTLFVGVHEGALFSFTLPNDPERLGYWGDATSTARQLAFGSNKERMVHLSQTTKNSLARMRLLPLTVAPTRESFYLDPHIELVKETAFSVGKRQSGNRESQVRRTRLSFCSAEGTSSTKDLTLAHFVMFLQSHGVDVAKFGKQSATSLDNFYKAVAIDKSCHLEAVRITEETAQLERIVVIIRLSVRVKESTGSVKELRMVSGDESGKASQPLTIVVPDAEKKEWTPSVEAHFRETFGIEDAQQKLAFTIDPKNCTYKEERSTSELLPDIVTVYKSHNVIIEVSNPRADGMNKLGLPSFADFFTESRGKRTYYTWLPFEKHREDKLMELLLANGVEVNEFSPNAFAELYDELYEKELSSLEFMGRELVRAVRVIKVDLQADIFGVNHRLMIKAKYQKGVCDVRDAGQPISMRMGPEEDWTDGLKSALTNRLGLTPELQNDVLFVDKMSHQVTEEIAYSRTYPGLKTIYEVNRVTVFISNCLDRRLALLGMPGGTDFTFARWEKISRVQGDGDRVLTQWSWLLCSSGKPKRGVRVSHMDSGAKSRDDKREKKRVPLPMSVAVDRTQRGVSSGTKMSLIRSVSRAGVADKSAVKLKCAMKNRETDWVRAKRAAARIRDRSYDCKQFFDDIVAAFPELVLYCVGDADATSCGRTADDEYQRTIGAFFALFFLMRIDIGGKEGFCYGFDENWAPRQALYVDVVLGPDAAELEIANVEEFKKRRQFERDCDWDALQQVVINAGLLKKQGGAHDESRTLTMLVLLAIHDIMKLTDLQPKVDKGTFCGFKAGDTITDHDVALSFVLSRMPELLPSFAGLNATQQESIRFTHCKLEYNMGWLVQAEAPPGPLLRAFRKVVVGGNVPSCDIAFYFVHWLTDLAGAEPFPLEGCEKFVLKFPQRILKQFVESFSFVESLSAQATETMIVEEYLIRRWRKEWGDLPEGPYSVARLRIACMAQQDGDEILNQFDGLPVDDKRVLGHEMALTGCKGQQYHRDNLHDSPYYKKGPAFLVYYAPALLQKAGKKDPRGALIVLAEVFRKARLLWPLSAKDADLSVTVRIDGLKELDVDKIVQPEQDIRFVLVKTSGIEAMVQMKRIEEFKTVDWKTHQVLSFQVATARVTQRERRRRTQIE